MDTKKLKQKVLDLAIRGKLVSQDPNDEPAYKLLERIQAEKQKLIAEGKIKTVKRTVYKNGDKITTKTEYISDVDTRIKARKELDRLLGISALQPLGQISAGGNVNIMIVDASKKDAVEDSRNNPVFMEMQDKTEEVDGEVVIVADEEEAETAK